MNEVQYERDEEIKARGKAAHECLMAVLQNYGCDHVGDLNRMVYKYTDCGASLGALVYAGDDNPGNWVYGSDLRELPADAFICALSLSSIVEGVDQCTDTHIVDLFSENFANPAYALDAYQKALQAVETEATEIWKATHGCHICAMHFGFVSSNGLEVCEGNDGCTPVWPDCPECGGHGAVI